MLRYILKELLYGASIMVGVIVLVFILFQGLPGDPARLTMGQRTDAKTLESVNKELGLDKPKSVQLLLYLNDISPISIIHPTDKYSYLKLFPVGGGKVLAL